MASSKASAVSVWNASGAGQEQARLRSPCTPSMRRTGGQYLLSRSEDDRVRRVLPAVRQCPFGVGDLLGGVRGLTQRAVFHRPLPRVDAADLVVDPDHRRDEPIQLGDVLRLGGLHHQGAVDREGQRRGVETVVDQPLCDVLGGHTGAFGDLAQVEDAFVGNQPGFPGVEHRDSGRSVPRRDSWRPAPRSWWPRSVRPDPSARGRPR